MDTAPFTKPKKTAVPRSIMGRVASSYPRLTKILVPLDFSGKSRQALRHAVPLAQKFSAKIDLLHVILPAAAAGKKSADPSPLPRALSQSALYRLEEMAIMLVPPAHRGQNHVRLGSPPAEILSTARRLDIDLIVLTTHGRSGVARFFVGSTAEQIMRNATCPVLSVRRR